ncbi:MAG: asparagine synthase-related protein [Bacteroidetes bacterium]|nr:asparagine synthase-related protein [Bacteroidota bacterium]
MSAIYGIINWFGNKVDVDQANAIQHTLKHRATDGAGVFHQNNILIGNLKLIISTYQKNEISPYQDGQYVITADTRIDNRKELISLLGVSGDHMKIPDSFLIVEAYKKWGNDCPKYLEGEFAFVIFNKADNVLFAATDHIGFRSFYYYSTTETFVFSSEIKGILAIKKNHYFNENSIVNYLSANNDGSTFDKDIFSLKGASYLIIDKNRTTPSIKKYWELKKLDKYSFKKEEDWSNCLRELLKQAVVKRLNTEKNIGITLSGGLDSSFLAAITATELQKKNKPLYAFSNLSHNDCNRINDERNYIKLMGKWYPNIQLNAVQPPFTVGPFTNINASFEKTETLSNPFVYANEALYAAAQEKRVGIIFSGFGGDFTISHNGEDIVYEQIKKGDFIQAAHNFFSLKHYHQLSILSSLKTFILDYTSLLNVYSIYIDKLKKRDIMPLNKNLLNSVEKKGRFGTSITSSIREKLVNMINSGTIGGLLFESQKKLSSYFEMDCSSPIMDKNINEFFLDVPAEQFYLNRKRRSLIRRAMADLVPQEIQMREDKGPYSPDFLTRFKYQEEQIMSILKNVELQKVKKFVNEPLLLSYLSELQLASDEMTPENSAKARFATWAIKLLGFIEWVEKKSYKIV